MRIFLLLLTQAFDAEPASTLEQFIKAVDQADAKHIHLLIFHWVSDIEHPLVNTNQEKFLKYTNYFKTNNFKVIGLRNYPSVETEK